MTPSSKNPIVRLTILNAPPSGKNQRQLVHDEAGRPRFIKSYKALQWMDDAIRQITASKRRQFQEKTPLKITAKIFYGDRRPDLDDSLLCDVLQKAEVIPNDRYLYEKHYYRHHDKESPRVEIQLELSELPV